MEHIIGFTARYQNEKARLNVQFYDRLQRTLNFMLKSCQSKKQQEQKKMEATAESAKGSNSRLALRLARFSCAMDQSSLKGALVRFFRNALDKDVVGYNGSPTPPKERPCDQYHYPKLPNSSETPAK